MTKQAADALLAMGTTDYVTVSHDGHYVQIDSYTDTTSPPAGDKLFSELFSLKSDIGNSVLFLAMERIEGVSLLTIRRKAPLKYDPLVRLGVVLAATALSRPEAMVIVFGVVAVAVIQRLRQRDLRAAAWWCAPLAAPLAWLVANRCDVRSSVMTTSSSSVVRGA